MPSSDGSGIFRSVQTASDLSVPGMISAIPRAVQLKKKDKEAKFSKRKLVVAPTLMQSTTFCCHIQHFCCISPPLRTSDTFFIFSCVTSAILLLLLSLAPRKENSSFSVRMLLLLHSRQKCSVCSAGSLKHPTVKCFCPSFSLPSSCRGPFTRYRDLLGPGFTLVSR